MWNIYALLQSQIYSFKRDELNLLTQVRIIKRKWFGGTQGSYLKSFQYVWDNLGMESTFSTVNSWHLNTEQSFLGKIYILIEIYYKYKIICSVFLINELLIVFLLWLSNAYANISSSDSHPSRALGLPKKGSCVFYPFLRQFQ